MKPKVLKTERDYKAALAHVEQLMAQSAPDEAELELWSLLVEKYEEENFPIAAPESSDVTRKVDWTKSAAFRITRRQKPLSAEESARIIRDAQGNW